MPDYTYHALDNKGSPVDGTMAAESPKQLDYQLEQLGYWVIEAHEKTRKKKNSAHKVARKELIDFFNGLHAMLASGISISDAMISIAEETSDENFASVIRDIHLHVEAGKSVDEAMSNHPKVFSNQIINLIRAGEYSGNLANICEDISHHLEWVDKIMADIKQASIYPIMVLIAVLGLVFLMFSFVVPKFNKIFISLNLELPALTRAVVQIGEFTVNWWWLILMLPVLIIVAIRISSHYFPAVGWYLDLMKLNLPVFGSLNRMIVLSRFCHNMSLLTRAGVNILDALGLCKGLVGNRIMEKAVSDTETAVNEGNRMTVALRKHEIISPIVLRMIVIGEESGRLDEALAHASARYDKEIPRMIQRVFAILEPLIMITLITIVGLIGGAVFLPMFSLMSGING